MLNEQISSVQRIAISAMVVALCLTSELLHGQFTTILDPVGGGNFPQGVFLDNDTLYGTTASGGLGGGTAWSYSISNGTRTLHSFSSSGTDGSGPFGGLLVSDGLIYGTTWRGGAFGGSGTIWSIDPNDCKPFFPFDNCNHDRLHTFTGGSGGGHPLGGLAQKGTTFFGTTSSGSSDNNGTIWSWDTAGGGFSTLHRFEFVFGDGSGPTGEVALINDILYGTTSGGGDNEDGTIWSLNTTTNEFINLHDFDGNEDGAMPTEGLTISGSTLYGTTSRGGSGNGTIWSFNTTNGELSPLHEFDGDDGRFPDGAVAVNGNTLYGTTQLGGTNSFGTLWSLDLISGSLATLHDFGDELGDDGGSEPSGPLVISGSKLYGTTRRGGFANVGTLWSFEIGDMPGDFDKDGDVDGFDFLKWQRGESPDPLSSEDLTAWQANFGATSAAENLSTAIPEPTTWLLLTLGMSVLLAGSRRSRPVALQF